MTTTPQPPVLTAALRRLRCLLALRGLLLVAAVPAAGLALAFLADATVILPVAIRAACFMVLAVLAGLTALVCLLLGRLWRGGRLAARLEQRTTQLGTRLTNAVDLQAAAPSATVVGEYLRQQAVAEGRTLAATVQVWPLLRRPLLVCATATLLLGLAWAAAPWLAGDLLRAVWPRFQDPHGDHPPYSHLAFSLTPADEAVLYGGAIDLHAEVGGGAVDRLYLFARPLDSSEAPTRTVMFRTPDGGYLQTLSNVREDLLVWVGDGRARSRRIRIPVRLTPRITLLEVDLDHPPHTALEGRTVTLGEEDLRLPRRTSIRLRVASNRPLGEGRLVLEPLAGGTAVELPLLPSATTDGLLEGTLQLDEAVAWAVHIRDQAGLPGSHPARGRFLVRPDRPPRIQVIEPGRDAVSTPRMAIPIEVRAEDDYGINAIHWLRSINGSLEDSSAVAFTRIADDPRRTLLLTAFDLGDLGLRPGDQIAYAFEALDNDPDGPQLATTAPFVIDIISEEDYQRMLRNQQSREAFLAEYLPLADTARRLAERAEALAAMAEDPEADSASREAEIAALNEALGEYRRQLDELAARRQEDPLLAAFDERIGSRFSELREAEVAMDALRGSEAGSAMAGEARALAQALGGMSAQMAEAVSDPGRHIDAVLQLMAAAQGFVALGQEQQRLAEWSRRFLDDTALDPRRQRMLLATLADQQQALREQCAGWAQGVHDLIAAIPDDPSYDALVTQAETFLAAVEAAGFDAEQQGAHGHFLAGSGSDGHRAAHRAWMLMDALIDKRDPGNLSGAAMACLSFQPQIQNMPQGARNRLQQIIDGAGMQAGGPGESSGYSMMSSQRAVYGPASDLTGRQTGRGEERWRSGGTGGTQADSPSAADDPVPHSDRRGRVRLRPDLPFPLRYRGVVGDYFRAVADSVDDDQELPP